MGYGCCSPFFFLSFLPWNTNILINFGSGFFYLKKVVVFSQNPNINGTYPTFQMMAISWTEFQMGQSVLSKIKFPQVLLPCHEIQFCSAQSLQPKVLEKFDKLTWLTVLACHCLGVKNAKLEFPFGGLLRSPENGWHSATWVAKGTQLSEKGHSRS